MMTLGTFFFFKSRAGTSGSSYNRDGHIPFIYLFLLTQQGGCGASCHVTERLVVQSLGKILKA